MLDTNVYIYNLGEVIVTWVLSLCSLCLGKRFFKCKIVICKANIAVVAVKGSKNNVMFHYWLSELLYNKSPVLFAVCVNSLSCGQPVF